MTLPQLPTGNVHYFQTSWCLNARVTLRLPEVGANIRELTEQEAEVLLKAVRRRNYSARVGGPNNSRVRRVREFVGRTVIEVMDTADPDALLRKAARIAGATERLALLSTTFVLPRKQLHRRVGIESDRESPELAMAFRVTGAKFRTLSKRGRAPDALIVDTRFARRFDRMGFHMLAHALVRSGDVAERLDRSVRWLAESRLEPLLESAIAKTAIALESMLVLSETEPVRSSVSERAAFLLSTNPDLRPQVARAVKEFYDARSGVVHGGQRKRSRVSVSLLEGADRLVLLCALALSANPVFQSSAELQTWCESTRWGVHRQIRRPFSRSPVRKALALIQPRLDVP